MTPADSTSETVRRHARAFTRTWPQTQADYQPPVPPTATARPMTRDELGTRRSARAQIADAAEASGWTWRAHHAVSPHAPGVESVVIRCRRFGAFAWSWRQIVVWWRSPGEGKALKFEAAFAFSVEAGRMHDLERLSGREVVARLREPAPVARSRPKYTRAG